MKHVWAINSDACVACWFTGIEKRQHGPRSCNFWLRVKQFITRDSVFFGTRYVEAEI